MICSIKGCESAVKYKGLCGKHYKRLWRHGDPNKTAYINHEQGILCAAPNCSNFVRRNNYCNSCSARVQRHGTPDKLNHRGEGKRIVVRIYNDKHRKRASTALGKPLPKSAVVHHHDGDIPTLVICPDQAYHMQLHMRLRRQQLTNQPGRLCDRVGKGL